ncbi:LysR family transcriptional regulator [Yinghuangia seranimata]|uniref:LysR family transcriptional regulator n=1 Tax=Yinghuangia seranimata TaxID=408067 RepID=UPI00248BF550|nr:LysR family transcriptional regulator [Yinghuangia seranimata]MDI2131078.1 LysR family transcriptional regulator [Yinghuangia seranimata]
MDPHLLRTFVAVARLGSFSAAARELGYTQSAVSQHIAALEHDLGAPLLGRRPVAPTPVGARLLEHAGPLLLRLDAARADIARLTSAPTDRLAIGATPLGAAELPGALAAVRRAHPGLVVTVRVLGRESVAREVATGALDVGLVDGMAAPTDPLHMGEATPLTSARVTEQPLAVALPAGHPLAGRPGLRLADLTDAQWIDAPDTGIPLAQLRRAVGGDGFRPALRYKGDDVRALVGLAAAGHGLTVLPTPALEGMAGVTAVPVGQPRVVHRTETLHAARTGDTAAELVAALTAAVAG